VVPVLRILSRPRNHGSTVTLLARTHCGDQHFRPRTCHIPTSLCFLIFEQNQDKVYSEVLIAGDLSQEDTSWAADNLWAFQFGWLSYGRSTPDAAELFYGKDTVYFAQPSPSQFVPGGSGLGSVNRSASVGLVGASNNTLTLTGKNAPKRGAGAILRYPLYSCYNYNSTP